MQAKAYARSSESEKQNNDRSIITINNDQHNCAYSCELPQFPESYEYETTLSASVALNLVVGIVLLTNILLFILNLRYFHHAFNWLSQKGWAKKFYRSSAIVLICLNCATLYGDLPFVSLNIHRDNTTTKRAVFVFKLSAMVLMPVLEFIWITFKVYRCYNPRIGKCKIFLHSIGFCQIPWFAHRLVIEVIISVILFVIAPAQTIGIITLLMFTILSAIIFIAQLFNIKYHCDWNTLSSFICISITGTISVVLILMIALLFITLVDNGLKSSGMGGFILSIIPPIIALIIGIYVNQETLDSFFTWSRPNASESNPTCDLMATVQNDDSEAVDERLPTADSNINEGTHLLYT